MSGFKSKPCTYLLSNGRIVRGDKISKQRKPVKDNGISYNYMHLMR